jgi:hypothetical protein
MIVAPARLIPSPSHPFPTVNLPHPHSPPVSAPTDHISPILPNANPKPALSTLSATPPSAMCRSRRLHAAFSSSFAQSVAPPLTLTTAPPPFSPPVDVDGYATRLPVFNFLAHPHITITPDRTTPTASHSHTRRSPTPPRVPDRLVDAAAVHRSCRHHLLLEPSP